MKSLFQIFLLFAMLINFAEAARCRSFDGTARTCAPDENWIFLADMAGGKSKAHLWLHKKRTESQINSLLVSEDTVNTFNRWGNYIGFAKSEFEKRDFKILGEKSIREDFTVLSVATPGGEKKFYQAYLKVGSRYWTFSCMGPDQTIIDRDCEKFFQTVEL